MTMTAAMRWVILSLLLGAAASRGRKPPKASAPLPHVYEPEEGDTRPRVALCIVGLFRDHRERVLPSLRRVLFNSTEWRLDVFIETWTTIGATRMQRLHARSDETGQILDPQWMREYPNLLSLHVERTPRNVSRHFHGIDLPPVLASHNPQSFGSTLPNLRRMYQCNEAKRAWEDANGFAYDAVIKTRPDYVCGGSRWLALLTALRLVLRHGREPAAQPYPFFHEHSWPHVMVSDKFAIGTSRAMDYYMSAWTALPRLFSSQRLSDAQGHRNHLIGERLLKVYMRAAPFDHMQTFCCQSPRKHHKLGRCKRDYAPGGVMHALFHKNRPAELLPAAVSAGGGEDGVDDDGVPVPADAPRLGLDELAEGGRQR